MTESRFAAAKAYMDDYGETCEATGEKAIDLDALGAILDGGMTVPPRVLAKFERAAFGLEHGSVTLALYVRDGKPRFEVERKESILP